jgi:deoxyhypusine synthase
LEVIRPVRLHVLRNVEFLIREFKRSGVLGMGKLTRATELFVDMIEDSDYTILLSMAGPMVPGGLRQIVIDMVKKEFIDVIVTSAANVVHDVIEALGYRHYKGSFRVNDSTLRDRSIGRIGNIFVSDDAFQAFENFMLRFFESIPPERRISTSDLLHLLGESLTVQYRESILGVASRKGVPIFCPGLTDAILSYQLIASKVKVDFVSDFSKLVDLQCNAKKVGVVILGGGMPKHYTLLASLLRGGVDAAIQITMDRPETGSLSGAKLKEALSWGKAKSPEKLVTITADATVILPIIFAAVLTIRYNRGRYA